MQISVSIILATAITFCVLPVAAEEANQVRQEEYKKAKFEVVEVPARPEPLLKQLEIPQWMLIARERRISI